MINHINKLAKKISSNCENGDQDYCYRVLNDLRSALLNDRYYTCMISKTKTTCVIKIKYIRDNKLHDVPEFIYELANCNKDHSVAGNGFYSLHTAQYNLFTALCPGMTGKNKMIPYNNLN